MSTLPFPPHTTPLIESGSRLITEVWNRWFRAIVNRGQNAPNILATVKLTAQSAAILTTTIALGTVGAGLYRVSTYLRITTAATTSSSATVTIGFTESGISLTQAGAAVTGNTTTTVQSLLATFRSDASVAITYAVAYASVGATAMRYRLDIIVEALS